MTKKQVHITGRVWVCPVCKFRLPEAEVEYAEVVCSRNQKCRQKNQHMVLEKKNETDTQ